MNIFNRSLTYIRRQPVKNGIFLVLIIILGTLTSGAIAVEGAIDNANRNLRRQMPAVVSIRYSIDMEELERLSERHAYYREIYFTTGVWNEVESSETPQPTLELLREIASFEQVQFYDFYIFNSLTSTQLAYLPAPQRPAIPWLQYDPYLGVMLGIHGVGTTGFLDVFSDFLYLREGRIFTEDEIVQQHEVSPVIISSRFANVNHLYIGSLFTGEVAFLKNHFERIGMPEAEDEQLIFEKSFYFEVIGIVEHLMFYELETAEAEDFHVNDFLLEMQLQQMLLEQRIFVPFTTATEIGHAYGRGLAMQNSGFEFIYVDDGYVSNVFILDDPLNIEVFRWQVEALEGNWTIDDFSLSFSDITIAMYHLQNISHIILVMAVGATIILTGLLVFLFLYDRQYEIGVYLALGEKKVSIGGQLILELLPLTLIGLTIALFVGNALSDGLAQEMLREELRNPRETFQIQLSHELEGMGYRFTLSHDDMLAAYETSMTVELVLFFYGVGVSTVLVATILPVIRAVNKSPKKVLF